MRRLNVITLLKQKNVPFYVDYKVQQRSYAEQANNSFSSAQYCRDLVEKSDYENYLCTLLLAGEHRRHAFTLRAFNVEVAKASQAASQELINKMRLQFWLDSIDKCYDKTQSYTSDHPVLRELKHTVHTNKLNKYYLKRLVSARNRESNAQFLTVRELEDYAEHSFSSLYYLLVEMCGIKDLNVDHAISHMGKAQGIATLLRAIPYMGRSKALNIPQEVLIKHGVSQERMLRDSANDKGVEECVFEVATAAFQHLEKARSLSAKVPKELRKIFLPAVTVDRYLERLRKANFRLTDPSCMQRDSMLPISLYWYNFRAKY